MAMDNFEELYAQRIRQAEKGIRDLQAKVQTTSGAKLDVAKEVPKKIHNKLKDLPTSPKKIRDPLREELVSLLKYILPPE